jgi:peroxiredoxin Q/BCP
MLKPGDKVPSISGTLQDGSAFDFAAPREGPLVVYFYPKAFTPGCTREACGFRDAHEELMGVAGSRILGVSRDTPEQLLKFKQQYRLPFDLVADKDGAVSRAFGAQIFGGLVPLSQRVTFILDRTGIVRKVFKNTFNADAHIAEAKATLQSMQAG